MQPFTRKSINPCGVATSKRDFLPPLYGEAEDMRPHATLQTMVDRTDMQVDGFHRAERALYFGQRFIAAHGLSRGHLFLRYVGADDVEPIQRRFRRDLESNRILVWAGIEKRVIPGIHAV